MKLLKTIRVVVCDKPHPEDRSLYSLWHYRRWCYKLRDGTWVYEE